MAKLRVLFGTSVLVIVWFSCAVIGDCTNNDGSTCTGSACCYDDIPKALGEGGGISLIQDCYPSGMTVNYTCPGNLRGPPNQICNNGVWSYPFAPTCEAITSCAQPTVPTDGSLIPTQSQYDLYTRINYACDDGYSLEGPDEAVCESSGTWNPSTTPSCKDSSPSATESNPSTPSKSSTSVTFSTDPNPSTPSSVMTSESFSRITESPSPNFLPYIGIAFAVIVSLIVALFGYIFRLHIKNNKLKKANNTMEMAGNSDNSSNLEAGNPDGIHHEYHDPSTRERTAVTVSSHQYEEIILHSTPTPESNRRDQSYDNVPNNHQSSKYVNVTIANFPGNAGISRWARKVMGKSK
ncbi:uncharacterized protein LOC135155766 [Lytechinus pictus]|uniref:uncharacterized protein LOC135155766 n=1 Tax=Lytechinus pictus TaxID=7653 RepID=UPI0030B9EB10